MRRYANDYREGVFSNDVAYGVRFSRNESRPCCCSRCGKEILDFATEQSFIDFGERLCDDCYTDELMVLGVVVNHRKD